MCSVYGCDIGVGMWYRVCDIGLEVWFMVCDVGFKQTIKNHKQKGIFYSKYISIYFQEDRFDLSKYHIRKKGIINNII